MENQTGKLYYKIGEVAEMLELPQSTLRFWEAEFGSYVAPKRNDKGTRFYTPKIIENLRLVKYLIKDRGLKIEAAKAEIKSNPSGVIRRAETVIKLKEIRTQLLTVIDSLHKFR